MLSSLIETAASSSDRFLSCYLLTAVDSDEEGCCILPATSLKALAGFMSRVGSSGNALSASSSAIALCALVTAVAIRLDAASVASAAAGIGAAAISGPGSNPSFLPGETAKELSTLAARACSASLVVAARFICALDVSEGAASRARASAEADAVALPALAAVERGLGSAPVAFRRIVPDALFFSLRVLRSAAVSAPLSAAAARVAAAAALVSLRHCRTGAPAMRPLGSPLDAAGFFRALLNGAGASASEIARTAALATPVPAPDTALAAAAISALPAEGGVVARVSEALIEATGGVETGPMSTVTHAARAAGLLDVAAAFLRRSLPSGAAVHAARSSATALDTFTLPLGDALALAESFCDAAAGISAGAAAVHAEAAAATVGH